MSYRFLFFSFAILLRREGRGLGAVHMFFNSYTKLSQGKLESISPEFREWWLQQARWWNATGSVGEPHSAMCCTSLLSKDTQSKFIPGYESINNQIYVSLVQVHNQPKWGFSLVPRPRDFKNVLMFDPGNDLENVPRIDPGNVLENVPRIDSGTFSRIDSGNDLEKFHDFVTSFPGRSRL